MGTSGAPDASPRAGLPACADASDDRHYWARNASEGATRLARMAGIQHATTPMTASISPTPTSVAGSVGSIPKSRLCM